MSNELILADLSDKAHDVARTIKTPRRHVNGILVLDKPKGLSSNAALQRVKYIFKAKKAGHTGSLDPLATGVLPICFGSATKLSQQLLDSDKKYTTIIKLGMTTTTGDAEGDILKQQEVNWLPDHEINQVVNSFIGEQEQIPSMYSAIKQNGVPLYKLARKGIEVVRKPRLIYIHSIEILNIDRQNNTMELAVHCSKGTYIRTLAEDLGHKLGCGAYVLELRRTMAGPYDSSVGRIVTIAQLEQILISNNNDYTYLDNLLIS